MVTMPMKSVSNQLPYKTSLVWTLDKDCCLTLPPPLTALQVTRVDGEKLLPYRTQLVQTLQLTLRMRCKQGYTLACNLLHHILRSTALTYPTDYCSVPGGFNRPLQEYLPIKVLQMCPMFM